MSMVERIIYDVVKTGLDYFKEDAGQRFERFLLTELRLSEAEAAKARIYFAGGENEDGDTLPARPPTLQHGYAQTGGPFPLWAIILGGEREAKTYLGDDAELLDSDGEFTRDENGDIVDPKIRRVEYLYNIQCLADNPDITLYYYHLLKRIVLSQHDVWIENDLEPPALTGADLLPDPRYLPNDVFGRQLSLTIEGDECWTEDLAATYSNQVRGIAVDDTGDGVTAGDAAASVIANVTSYTGS